MPNNIFTPIQFCFRLGWVRSKPDPRLFWPTRHYSGKLLENPSQPIINIFLNQPDSSLLLGTSRPTYLNQAQFFLESVLFSETAYLFLCNIMCYVWGLEEDITVLLQRKLLWFFSEYNLLTRTHTTKKCSKRLKNRCKSMNESDDLAHTHF